MPGGLMQLLAYGAQDAYLTGSPQITFFKHIYRRDRISEGKRSEGEQQLIVEKIKANEIEVEIHIGQEHDINFDPDPDIDENDIVFVIRI